MAVSVIDVDDGGADYGSLSAWEADLSGTLSAIEEADCQVTGGTPSADTTSFEFSGFTPTASYYPLVNATGTHRHSGSWTDAKFRMIVNDDDCFNIASGINYIRFDGMQFKRTYTSASWGVCCNSNNWATSDIRFGDCIIQAPNTNGNNVGLKCVANDANSVFHVYNCLIEEAEYGIQGDSSSAAGNVYIYNSTVVKCYTDGIIETGSAALTAKNCTVADTPDDFDGVTTIDYCASDDGDGTNAQTLSGTRADDFTDFSGGDYSIASGSVQENNGVTDPDSWGGYSDDIIGISRPQGASWDIGAWERVAAGAIAPTGVLYGPLVGPMGGPV